MEKLRFFGSDLESTGLLHHLKAQGDKARLHNFALMSTTSKKHMILHPMEGDAKEKLQAILNRGDTVLVMHNGICYDMEALKFFGFDVSKVKIIDTLYLAWYLDFFKENPRYGLEQYGVELGFPKPPIDNWEDLTQEEYDFRVFGDINIQTKLWKKLCKQFAELYGLPDDDMLETNVYNHHCTKYLMWKGEELRQQQENKWKFDEVSAQPLLEKIEGLVEEKMEMLATVMPRVPVYKITKRPKKPFKANGEMSAIGLKWDELCKENNVLFNQVEEIKHEVSRKEPNPASPNQVKDWLFSLGWVPETFEFKKDENGERKIPQVYLKGSGGQVCPSVERLAEEVPEVEHLVGLGVLKHRRAMIAGWLENHKDGYLEARAQGFTNTLRLKHAELVNLPSSRVMLGTEIRSLLGVRDPNHILMGSDLSSLENRLKFHFQMPLDPEYVKAQMSDDFDPHLAIAVMAGLITEDESNFYKVVNGGFDADRYMTDTLAEMLSWSESKKESEVKRIAVIRGIGKGGNYSCLPMDTTVLTPKGFVEFSDLKVGDVVISYKDGVLVEDEILHTHFYRDADIHHFGDSKKVLRATSNHRWLTAQRGEVLTYKDFTEFNSETRILTTAPYVGGISDVSDDEARLVGWLLSDGSFSDGKVSISQSINKFTSEITGLLDRMGLRYRSYQSPRDNGNHVMIYSLSRPEVSSLFDRLGCSLLKQGFNWSEWVMNLSRSAIEAFVHTFWLGDGDVKNTKSFEISQNSGDVADSVLLAMYLLGEGRVKQEGLGVCKTLRKHKTRYISTQRKSTKDIQKGDVFCLTTHNSNFVIKQDGEIMITGNCQYGAGAKTVARTTKSSLEVGKMIVDGYRDLNWSIDVIANNTSIKKTSFGDFQLNPLNRMYYPLKTAKDRFSTLIQGSGSYVLDLWLMFIHKRLNLAMKAGLFKIRPLLIGQFHDECIFECHKDDQELMRSVVDDSIQDVNKAMKLHVDLGCDIQFGENYSEIH